MNTQNTINIRPKVHRFWAFASVFYLLCTPWSYAAENPYQETEVERAASDVVMEFNRFDFLESIVSASDGTLYTTDLLNGIVYSIKAGNLTKLVDIDGKLVGRKRVAGRPRPSANPLLVGRYGHGDDVYFVRGLMDEINIYNISLTPGELTELYEKTMRK